MDVRLLNLDQAGEIKSMFKKLTFEDEFMMGVKRLFSSSIDNLLFQDDSKTIPCSATFVR